MAVRMDADGEDYTRSLALGAQTALTVCGWFMLSVDRNTWSTIFSIDNGTSDNWLMQTGADGTTMATVFDASTQQGIGSMTVGTWYFICLATSGTTGSIYYRTAANPTLTTVGVTSVTANVNAATLRLGESPWGSEWWNGRITAVQVYNAQLSAAEAQNESMQYVPRRLTNLVAWYPLVKPETADYSGNTRTLSGGAGTATEDGPPVPWLATSPRLILPTSAGGTSHDGNASLTATATGTAAGTSTKPAAATVTNTATVTTAGTTAKPAAATLTATAAVTASATVTKSASAALTSTATVTAAGDVGAAPELADASLTATAAATATAQSAKSAAASVSTAAGVTAAGTSSKPAGAALTATASAAAAASATKPAGAISPVTATVTATGSATKPAAALLTAAATITAAMTTEQVVDFLCQDLAGQTSLVAHGGDATPVAYGGQPGVIHYGGQPEPVAYDGAAVAVAYGGSQPELVGHGGQLELVSYGGTATICGR